MSCQHPIPLLIFSLIPFSPSLHTLICTLILLPSAPLYGKAALLSTLWPHSLSAVKTIESTKAFVSFNEL